MDRKRTLYGRRRGRPLRENRQALVDRLFGDRYPEALGPDVRHVAFHDALPGRVECWPVVGKEDTDDEADDWTAPVDRVSPRAPQVVLA